MGMSGRGGSKRALVAAAGMAGLLPGAAGAVTPACGATGYEVSLEYRFGTRGNVGNIADLKRLFVHDATWGRINMELQAFPEFNERNHVFENDCLALTGRHDASEIDVMESVCNPPKDDRSHVYQYDHGPGAGKTISDPGGLGEKGWWQPYGPLPGGDMSGRWAAYSVVWTADRAVKYVDDKEGISREFRWTGPEKANIHVYLSIGSEKLDWPGPVPPETFQGDNAVFRIRSIRVFVPKEKP